MISADRRVRGILAEQSACQYLQAQGLTILLKNYSCYFGEIDLIMREAEVVVFVEVRSRNRKDFGTASESVNHTKRQKLIKTATHFLQKKRWLHKVTSRFDIVGISSMAENEELEWIKNAFCP